MNGSQLSVDTLVGVLSLYFGVRNLTENEQQSVRLYETLKIVYHNIILSSIMK